MVDDKTRFEEFEKKFTLLLIGTAILFIIFLIASGCGTTWLKVITAIITIAVCILSLAYLYMTKLLTQPRSLWMTTASAAILLCLLFSLIVGFPAPV